MEKLLILSKLSYKFSKKYMINYLKSLGKPFLFGFLGIFLLFLGIISPILIILSFLSIPCICYAFWRGYVITYALIPCANDFIKEAPKEFSYYVDLVKKTEAKFAGYVGFCAILTIALIIPCIFFIALTIPVASILYNPFGMSDIMAKIEIPIVINALILAPFLNFALCAYYFKEYKESYFSIFLNCYKKLDTIGIIIAFLFTFLSVKAGVVYMLASLILNPFVYSINAFWYSTKQKN